MENSISVLLGSGFSAPMGYPTGTQLNDRISNCTGQDFAFHTDGRLVTSTSQDLLKSLGYSQLSQAFNNCKLQIKKFEEEKGYFDYEEFYDSLVPINTNENMPDEVKDIYPQLISNFLKDRDGNKFYDNAPQIGGLFPGYTGILNCFQKLSNKYTINVHTLNHDLFFERLNSTDWLSGKICDGFEELDSPYYGELNVQGRRYKIRLKKYTGIYKNIIRLYKLHGSLDYVPYFFKGEKSIALPENYIKIRYGMNVRELFKEWRNDKGEWEYDYCNFNYHADFLTGTTSKILRYREPLLYKKLFGLFKENLKEASMLIIIGYGGRDTEINKKLLENFDHRNCNSFIMDPYPGEAVQKLAIGLNATLIQKNLESINFTDLEIEA